MLTGCGERRFGVGEVGWVLAVVFQKPMLIDGKVGISFQIGGRHGKGWLRWVCELFYFMIYI